MARFRFKVRLKGFNFIAHVPAGQQLEPNEDVLLVAPVDPKWIDPPAKGKATGVPATWLLVEAKDEKDAVKLFRKAHRLEREPAAPFVVEAA